MTQRLSGVIKDKTFDLSEETSYLRKVINTRKNEAKRGVHTQLTTDKVTNMCDNMRAIMANDR